MASLPLQLEIQGAAGNFTFMVPGPFEPRCEAVFKDAANPPEVTELRWTWQFPGALLVSTNTTSETLWDQWLAFVAKFQTRGSSPTYARIVRDPSGANVVEWTLGPSTYEGLRFEAIQAGRASIPTASAAAWRTLIPVDLTISATQKLPDGNGIVGWDQQVSYTYDEAGLQIVEWRTRVTTAEETDARTKARTYGLIPIATYGDRYSYLTNGDDGVEVTVEDADEENSRVPTVATGVCRLKQWGVSIGTSGPGVSPTSVSYSIRTRRDEDENVITYTASAVGPGARTWVLSKRPSGIAVTEAEEFEEQAQRRYEATWTQRYKREKDKTKQSTRSMRVEISGGHAAFDYEPVVGGYPPLEFEGAVSPWQVVVSFSFRQVGADFEYREEHPLPPLEVFTSLGLRLDYDASVEGEPYLAQAGADTSGDEWARECRYVFRAGQRPQLEEMRQALARRADTTGSYYLSAS